MAVAQTLGLRINITYFSALVIVLSLPTGSFARAQGNLSSEEIVRSVVSAEQNASRWKPPFIYTCIEQSERTNGHIWKEQVADISQGRLRYLVAEDGHPLTADQRNEEIARLKSIAANPNPFIRHEQARQNDERHAQQMLDILPRAFVFEKPVSEGNWIRINYKPNPNYIPQTFEERALHGMAGTLLVDARTRRLHQLSGQLVDDVTYGFGIFGTLHRGSTFTTTRDLVAPNVWKTISLDTHIDGRIAFLKTITRNQHSVHQDFHLLSPETSIMQAVDLLTR